MREAAQRGGRSSADVAVPEGVAGHLHAVAGALGALGMDTLKEFQVLATLSSLTVLTRRTWLPIRREARAKCTSILENMWQGTH